MENFWAWSTQGYTDVIGYFFWPIMLSAIIGYIYLKNQSAVVASIAILLFLSAFAFTGIFARLSAFVMILQLIVTLACTGLVIMFVSKWRS
jgi:hypothetical protein